MREVVPVRRELGVRTLFNVLGPLTNPAGVPNQLLGVFSEDLLEPLAQVLQRLGSVLHNVEERLHELVRVAGQLWQGRIVVPQKA